MSSKVGRFFYLTISFVLGAFFLVIGIFSLILPWFPFLQMAIIQLILDKALILSLFGLGLILIGLSILTYAIISSRRSYIYIRTGHQAITVDESLIQQYLETYWKEHFPRHHIPARLKIKKNTIHITADLPCLPQAEQKIFLERVRHDFEDIFGRLLGYPHEIRLAASFQPEAIIS